jgi:putative component of toxin-antitoxin plasmid stabilization module
MSVPGVLDVVKGKVILLFCGGDKSTQNKDIKAATDFRKTYLEDHS